MLTADHGFMPAPEVSQAQGLVAGRVGSSQMLGRINAALEKRFAVPKLALGFSASAILIDKKAVALRGLDANAVHEATREALLAEPSIAAAYTRRQLETRGARSAPFFDAMVKSWHPQVSGDVQYVLKPYWMFASSSAMATHGTPHDYDQHVPILFWGPRWLGPG